MNEKRAIELCIRHRDPSGFEFLVRRFRREAFYHAFTFTGNREDAADICQESFSRAFRAIPGIKHLDRFYPWFYRILRNTSINFLKKRNRSTGYSERMIEKDTAAAPDPETVYEIIERNHRLWRIIRGMKHEFREILVLKYVDNRSYDEISQLLGIPKGTVMSRLYHARKKFRDIYMSMEVTDGR